MKHPSPRDTDILTRDLAWALDPVLFARQALGFVADDWQSQVLRWSGKRLLMNCSRQSGKSTTTAIKALHRALFEPGVLVLVVSPSQRQSGELFRKVVAFVNRLDLRPALVEENRLSIAFAHGARIVSLPGSAATIRGFSGPGLVVEDEASRVDDALFVALAPMLAVSQGQMILLSTPYGQRGHFYEMWQHGGDEWERVQVPAHDCPRISPEFLRGERQRMGDRFFAQEYLCEFRDTVEQVFATDLIDQMFAPSGRKSLFGTGRAEKPVSPEAPTPLRNGSPLTSLTMGGQGRFPFQEVQGALPPDGGIGGVPQTNFLPPLSPARRERGGG